MLIVRDGNARGWFLSYVASPLFFFHFNGWLRNSWNKNFSAFPFSLSLPPSTPPLHHSSFGWHAKKPAKGNLYFIFYTSTRKGEKFDFAISLLIPFFLVFWGEFRWAISFFFIPYYCKIWFYRTFDFETTWSWY